MGRHFPPTQEMPFECLALEDSLSGFHRYKTIRETILSRLPSPGHYTTSRLKRTPSLPVKKAYFVVLELQPKGYVLRFPHI